jgi:hypothetical protein
MRGKRKPSKKPKTNRPLHRRKTVQEANKVMIDYFLDQLNTVRQEVSNLRNEVAESNDQLWKNQTQQNAGLSSAEEHVVLLRRVLNDALGGCTRVMTIERRKEGSEELEEVQTIDWGWYGEQLFCSDDPNTFMSGVVLTPEEIAERTEKANAKKRHDVVLYLAGQAAAKDTEGLRKALEEEDLDEYLKKFLPEKVEWEEEMHDIAPAIVEQVMQQRETMRLQQEKMEKVKERSLLKNTVAKIVACGDGEMFRNATDEQKIKLVAEALPTVVQWTDSMASILDEVIEEVLKEAEEKEAKRQQASAAEENDPEEVEAAKQELLEETKQFGEDASKVMELIEAGKEDEARAAMAQLEERVKAKEAEAEKNAPHIPDGATVFGG